MDIWIDLDSGAYGVMSTLRIVRAENIKDVVDIANMSDADRIQLAKDKGEETSAHKLRYNSPRIDFGNTRFNTPLVPKRAKPMTFKSIHDARRVLQYLNEVLERYGFVTASDYYMMCAVDTVRDDGNWGWTDLSRVNIVEVQDGHMLDFPPMGRMAKTP